jgi:hypothetical protein
MKQVIVFQDQETSRAAIITPADGYTTDDALSAIPELTPYIIIDDSSLPKDRYFRDAWELIDLQISVNIAKANDIHKDRLRELRSPKLLALDVEYIKALELGDTVKQQEISAIKQELRDVTNFPLIEDLEQLKAYIPSVLS